MFRKVLLQIQEKVRNRDYGMTYHSKREMNEDELTIYNTNKM